MTTPTPTPQDYIPAEAYLFFPKTHELRSKDGQRAIFDGNTEFSEDERQKIAKLKDFAAEKSYTFKPIWTDNMLLRFLYANNFKKSKTLDSIKSHTAWREMRLPVQIDEPLRNFLNSGLLYVHGRDSQFRPIVIFNVSLIDPKKADMELVIKAMTFWLEYVIDEWMLPGQVENWVFMANLKGVKVATLALQSMRKLFTYLSDNYKCRLTTLYMLNVSSAMYVPWQIVKGFLDDVTVQKIQFYKSQIPTTLFATTNKEQVEQKYGGTAPNATQFWPPVIPSNNYFVSPKNSEALISKEEYTARYKKGNLANMRLSESLIIDDTPNPTDDQGLPKMMSQSIDHAQIRAFRSKMEDVDGTFTFEGFGYVSVINTKTTVDADTADLELEEEEGEEYTDYIDDMEESPEIHGERSPVKEFRASFIAQLMLEQGKA